MIRRFLPPDYQQTLYHQFHNCKQGARSVSQYTEEFLRLQTRCHLKESEEHQVARYTEGIKWQILDKMGLAPIYTVDEAIVTATRAEKLLQAIPTRPSAGRQENLAASHTAPSEGVGRPDSTRTVDTRVHNNGGRQNNPRGRSTNNPYN